MRPRRAACCPRAVSPIHSVGGARPTLLHICTQSWQAVGGHGANLGSGQAGPCQRWGVGAGQAQRAPLFSWHFPEAEFAQISRRGPSISPSTSDWEESPGT